MYKIVKDVLNSGDYELNAMLKKIASLWIDGKLTDKEYEELNAIARNGATPERSIDIYAKLEELDQRLLAVENGNQTTEPEECPEFVVGKWYYNGNKVTFEGKQYMCIAPEGTACVWSPKDYPAYWEAM